MLQVETEAREPYREQGAVQILQKFRTNTSGAVSCLALILQACTVGHVVHWLIVLVDGSHKSKQIGIISRTISTRPRLPRTCRK